MNLQMLIDLPPWEWPEGAGAFLLGVLSDGGAAQADLLMAAELAGEYVVASDALSLALLAIVRDDKASEALRARAAISLGPVLEEMDDEVGGGEDTFLDSGDLPISVDTFETIVETLAQLYADAAIPAELRRAILEASVRAPQPWHDEAIRSAYADADTAWRLSGVFGMCYVPGFAAQIVASLDDPELEHWAVVAAGNWGLDEAWDHVAALVETPPADRDLLLVAIEAVANIRPGEAAELLEHLANADDEEIADAAGYALSLAVGFGGDGLGGDDDDGEDDVDDDEDDGDDSLF